MPKAEENEVYIGDAVYASYDNGYVRLRTKRTVKTMDGMLSKSVMHYIDLDSSVYQNLKSFAEVAFHLED